MVGWTFRFIFKHIISLGFFLLFLAQYKKRYVRFLRISNYFVFLLFYTQTHRNRVKKKFD